MLFIPAAGNRFKAIQSNNSGRPTAPQGTAITPVIGSKSSWVQIIASLSADTYGLIICLNGNNASASSRNTVVDIGIGAAASEIVLIPDLIGGNAVNHNVTGGGVWYYFPVRIPAGTRIAARAQGSAAANISCFIQAQQKPQNPEALRTLGFVEAIGITAPGGVALTAGTTSNGAWTLLGATVRECWHWQVGLQATTAETSQLANAIYVDVAEGDGTNFNVILDSVPFYTNTAEGLACGLFALGCEARVPAGRNIYARAQTTGNIDGYNIAAYGGGG